MYHDQALIPVKTIDFRNTVNVTLGLGFIRTSLTMAQPLTRPQALTVLQTV